MISLIVHRIVAASANASFPVSATALSHSTVLRAKRDGARISALVSATAEECANKAFANVRQDGPGTIAVFRHALRIAQVKGSAQFPGYATAKRTFTVLSVRNSDARMTAATMGDAITSLANASAFLDIPVISVIKLIAPRDASMLAAVVLSLIFAFVHQTILK